MAISAAVIGALKVALKSAAKKVAVEVGKEAVKGGTKAAVKQAAKKALEEVGKKAMTDTQAIILNRLKTAPNKILFETASKELGLPVSEVRKLVKTFKQSPKMKDLAKGTNFKQAATQRLKKDFNLKSGDKIRDIIKKAEKYNEFFDRQEKNQDNGGDTRDINGLVKVYLEEAQDEFIARVMGASGLQSKRKAQVKYDLNIMKYFDSSKKYTDDNLTMVKKLLYNIGEDIENYETDSGEDDIRLIDGDGGWERHTVGGVIDFINSVKEDTRLALS